MRVTEQTIKRALRTFFQSAVAYVMVNALCINYAEVKGGLQNALIGLAISAMSAGIAGVMNMERIEE